jgi:hypothetical protein
MRKTKSHEYLLKHSQERSEKYPGNYIAIVEDELVGVSSSEHEVFEKVILNISLDSCTLIHLIKTGLLDIK